MRLTVTKEQLQIARDNDLKLYSTPTVSGSLDNCYWASSASWRDDVVIATVSDFIDHDDLDDLIDDGQVYEYIAPDTLEELLQEQ